ncbi:MAG: phosphoserine transaminase [Alphaproteobacteria bacterium]|nr:phosphoserine transaminase [Alphaproteobacteria bacterium]
MSQKPSNKPNNPNFSSGPCSKRPGWSLEALSGAMLGRSHRAGPAKARLKEVIEMHREILGIPADYKIGIVPASDTGAFEMAMWSMLGARGVDVFAWESFSGDWLKDITGQLKLDNVNTYNAGYGALPDLSQVDPANDCVFVWNGTTSGVCVPNGDWISRSREGLTFCDATSAVFAYDMPWDKLDVITWSWQKVLGGEAAHGMIVLSPRAVERLESYKPDRPLPKIFRMTKGDKLNDGIFEGATINTPSMLAVEDCLDALRWVKSIGGLKGSIARAKSNFAEIKNWVEKTEWAAFLAEKEDSTSITSVCLKITDGWFSAMSEDDQLAFVKTMTKTLDSEGVAYDIAGYRDAPAGLRIWCGATVESSDVAALMPWIEWAYETTKAQTQESAAA